jgi:hypothetical protein
MGTQWVGEWVARGWGYRFPRAVSSRAGQGFEPSRLLAPEIHRGLRRYSQRKTMLEHVKGNPNSALTGPLLVDDDGVPRFWPLVWAIYQSIGAASSLEKKLRYIEALYSHSQEIAGPSFPDLDSAIARMDVEQLTSLLQAYYVHVANSNPISCASQYKWSSATKFVLAVANLRLNAPSSREEIDLLRTAIAELTLINQPLYSSRQSRPTRVRALPAEVVDHLYALLDPTSRNNPFCRPRTIWNAWILFILLLHQGLRRGEILSAPCNTIFSGRVRNSGQERFWIRVKSNQYEEDERYSKPCHKNEFSPGLPGLNCASGEERHWTRRAYGPREEVPA